MKRHQLQNAIKNLMRAIHGIEAAQNCSNVLKAARINLVDQGSMNEAKTKIFREIRNLESALAALSND